MEVCDIKFIYLYNSLPCALAKLPAAFGLTELKKGYFIHFFNTEKNQNYVGPYPAVHHYNPEDMSIAKEKPSSPDTPNIRTTVSEKSFWTIVYRISTSCAVAVRNLDPSSMPRSQ
jgi:hypothetical protein